VAAVHLPAAPVLVVSTRGGGLADSLAEHLRRPVDFLNFSMLRGNDFYEGPERHAS
jgi:hypothetical protein